MEIKLQAQQKKKASQLMVVSMTRKTKVRALKLEEEEK